MKSIYTSIIAGIIIFFLGFITGISINSTRAEQLKVQNTTEITSVHQEQVYINGVRYTVVTSNAPSMVIMR